jgi:hypothetical protein
VATLLASLAAVLRTQSGKIKQGRMTITVDIPEELASQLIAAGQEPTRAALEAIALEGYRSDRLSTAEVRRLLGFGTGMEVDAFLKGHGVFLPYTEEDLAHDIEVASHVARRAQSERLERPSDQRRAG